MSSKTRTHNKEAPEKTGASFGERLKKGGRLRFREKGTGESEFPGSRTSAGKLDQAPEPWRLFRGFGFQGSELRGFQ